MILKNRNAAIIKFSTHHTSNTQPLKCNMQSWKRWRNHERLINGCIRNNCFSSYIFSTWSMICKHSNVQTYWWFKSPNYFRLYTDFMHIPIAQHWSECVPCALNPFVVFYNPICHDDEVITTDPLLPRCNATHVNLHRLCIFILNIRRTA